MYLFQALLICFPLSHHLIYGTRKKVKYKPTSLTLLGCRLPHKIVNKWLGNRALTPFLFEFFFHFLYILLNMKTQKGADAACGYCEKLILLLHTAWNEEDSGLPNWKLESYGALLVTLGWVLSVKLTGPMPPMVNIMGDVC